MKKVKYLKILNLDKYPIVEIFLTPDSMVQSIEVDE